jgi:hypothetical protein
MSTQVPMTTLATGEEGPGPTTLATGEETEYLDASILPLNQDPSTMATGEEGGTPSTMATGEEGGLSVQIALDNPFGLF